ncbi:hypothetical protein TRFO_01762 [Tritrichomonas foetus]|uniref:U1-C C2H2-type zinc finger domain-containing protein n=1 Tax=Tritrichomonas foetus TaxID=1144522 RepID=A0A1J4JPR8_9EUKA|nr:hypothetical protein TRFO_01762 [Tritrichomonas foetus]|eukprot:OHT01151.1 hypothetical protein TRFO_01762 [Tritrichomonas foetus]
MLTLDKGPQAQNRVYCKYCNQWVDNNIKSINQHNNYITHEVNVKKWNAARVRERKNEEKTNKEIDEELAIIQAKAQTQHLLQDVMKSDRNLIKEEHEKQQENFDIARDLYGDDLFKQMIEPKKEVNKTVIYNDIMRSLPTRIQKKHRTLIKEFKP